MSGLRLGHRVLAIPGRDPRIFFQMAARAGLSGRALALAADTDAASRLGQQATKQGVVADVDVLTVPLPVADESFDVVVIDDRTPRLPGGDTPALLPSARRALRPGGRLLVVLPLEGSPLARMAGRGRPPDVSALLSDLRDTGFAAGRLLGVQGSMAFVEATRPLAA